MSVGYVSKYTELGGFIIAYQIWGSPEDTLVCVPGKISHLEAVLEDNEYPKWIRESSKSFRVIIFGKRGQGLSDRDSSTPNLEERMDDISAIVSAENLDQFFLFGPSEVAAISLVYVATHTTEVKSVAVFGGTAKFTIADDYKFVPEYEVMLANMLFSWGAGNSCHYFCPQKMPEKKAFFEKLERMVCSTKTLQGILELISKIDVRPTLADINVPVLVLHSRDDATISKLNGRPLADNIPVARYIEHPIVGHLPLYEKRENIVKDLIVFFSKIGNNMHSADRNLATILFANIENYIKLMTEMGDEKRSEKMNQHDEIMRATIESFNGQLVRNTGDGVLAVFDGPARRSKVPCIALEN